MKNWRTKLISTLGGIWNLVPVLADGIQPGDWQAIGVTVSMVWATWLGRDVLANIQAQNAVMLKAQGIPIKAQEEAVKVVGKE